MVFENLFRIIDFHLWFDFLIFSTETEWRPWCNTWCLLWANMCVFVQACVFVCKHVCLCASMCACVQALGKNDSYIWIDFSKQGIMLVRVCLKSFEIYWIKNDFSRCLQQGGVYGVRNVSLVKQLVSCCKCLFQKTCSNLLINGLFKQWIVLFRKM